MADTKISDLTSGVIGTGDFVPAARAGSNVKINLYDAIGKPYVGDQAVGVLVTTGSGQLLSNTALTNTPRGRVDVYRNGQRLNLAGHFTGECYFSANTGVTAKALGSAAAGDKLYRGSGMTVDTAADELIHLCYIS